MKCQYCGSEVLEEYVHCPKCGAIIVRPRTIDEALIKTTKQRVINAVARRKSTDTIVPYSIVWAYITLWLAEIALSIFTTLYVLSKVNISNLDNWRDVYGVYTIERYVAASLSILGVAILLYLYYIFIRRQNEHYIRERDLRAAIIPLVSAAAASHERPYILEGDLWMMRNMHRVAERHRAPWFWVLAAMMPTILSLGIYLTTLSDSGLELTQAYAAIALLAIALILLVSVILMFYMYWFLGKEMFDHDLRWRSFSVAAGNALSKLGFACSTPYWTNSLPKRSFGLYLFLAFFTLGIFMLYWLYALAKDPNDHFKSQWEFEDSLLRALGSRSTPDL